MTTQSQPPSPFLYSVTTLSIHIYSNILIYRLPHNEMMNDAIETPINIQLFFVTVIKGLHVPGFIKVSQLVKHLKHITHQSHHHTGQRLLLDTKQKQNKSKAACQSLSVSTAWLSAQSSMSRYLLQCVGWVEDGRAGTARGRGGGLGAARGSASAWALHSQALFITEAKLGQQLLVPIHCQLTHGEGTGKGPERGEKRGIEVVWGCVYPCHKNGGSGPNRQWRGSGTLPRKIYCALICSL